MAELNLYDPYKHPEDWTPEMYKKLEQAREINEEWWLPHKRQGDRLGGVLAMTEMHEQYFGMHRAIVKAGFYGRTIPKKYGGPGWSMYQCGLLSAEITKLGMSPRYEDGYFYGDPAVHVLEKWVPDEAAKREYFKRIMEGGFCTYWCTDPESGVDMGAMRGTATRDGDNYVLNGPKWWMAQSSPGAMGTNWHLVLMKTDPTKRTAGLTLFIVNDEEPGILRGREGDLLGARYGCARYELLLKDVKVNKKYLGSPEGQGLYALVDSMNKHMNNQAFQAVGVQEAAIQVAVDYTSQNIRWDHQLIEYQGVHFPIADLWVTAEASRAMVAKANKLYDQGDAEALHGKWSALAFRIAAPGALQACRVGLELMGARGIEREEGWPLEMMYRDSFIFQLYRTPNIDRKFLASFLLGRRL